MKRSIIYFTRTGATKSRALALGKKIEADVFELTDQEAWYGPMGLLKGLWISLINKEMKLEYDPIALESDTLIIMSPLWLEGPSPAVKTFLKSIKHDNIYLVLSNHASPITHILKKYTKKYKGINTLMG